MAAAASDDSGVKHQAMRRHGCHWPFAPLQLLSWALLLLLGAAFYALIIPLCPAQAKEAVAATFGCVMAVTFGLALTTTCIDPADPTVKATHQSRANKGGKAQAAAKAAAAADASVESEEEEGGDDEQQARGMDGSGHRRGTLMTMDNAPGVYCFLCRVDVLESSAHCRHCRKCCDGFDHHCAWLNTCIGRPNYAPFIGTVTAALVLLGLETAGAALLLVRFGLQRDAFVEQATAALPSLPPNACAGLLALLLAATVLLLLLVAQLLCFHGMLRAQGLTTYQFVLRETQRRAARAEAAAARRRHRQQVMTAASAAVGTMAGGGGGGGKAPPPSSATITATEERQQQRVVLMSSPSRSCVGDGDGGGGGGGGRSWWPWRLLNKPQRRAAGLPGDEFLASLPDDESDEQGLGPAGSVAAAAAASCPAV